MAKYRITAPDGGTYEVTAPDDATQEQVLSYAQANYQSPPKADFSGVQGGVRSTDDGRLADGWKGGIARDVMGGARSVIQGVGGLVGAVGGDAFNHYLVPGDQPSYRDAAVGLSDRLGLPKPQTAKERVLGDVGEALTGTALTMGAGSVANLGRPVVSATAPTVGNRLADLATAQPKLQALSTVTGAGAASTARESGAGQGTQLAAGLAGGLLPGLTGMTGAATLRGAVRGKSGADMQRTIDDFARVGATPSVGQASGNWAAQGAENLLAGGPTSSGVMARFAGRQADDIGAGLGKTADDLSRNASGGRAGRAIKRGIRSFRDQFKATQTELYDRLDSFIPGDQRIDIARTREAIKQLNAPIPGAPNTSKFFQNSRIAGIGSALEKDLATPTDAHRALDDALAKLDGLYASRNAATQDAGRFSAFANEQANRIDQFYPVPGQPRISGRYSPSVQRAQEGAQAATEATDIARGRVSQAREIETTLGELQAAVDATGGKLPYEAIKKLRTLVGQELDDAGLMSDFPRSKFTALYRALSGDLEGSARAAGPEAAQAWSRANNYTKFGMDRMEALQAVIDKKGGPEKVFQAAMSGTRDGGTTLRAVMQSLPPDGQKAVTAAVIKRMGMPTPGQAGVDGAEQFSAATFLTNWNKVSPEARKAMFDRHGPGFSASMDRIARVADNIKSGSKVFQNPSGTANRAAALTYGGSLVASMLDPSLVTTGSLVAGGAAANYMARKMTDPDFVRWLARSTALPVGSATAQINALRQIGERNGDQELIEIANVLAQEKSPEQGRAASQ